MFNNDYISPGHIESDPASHEDLRLRQAVAVTSRSGMQTERKDSGNDLGMMMICRAGLKWLLPVFKSPNTTP